jgi:hypothetical protein
MAIELQVSSLTLPRLLCRGARTVSRDGGGRLPRSCRSGRLVFTRGSGGDFLCAVRPWSCGSPLRPCGVAEQA